MTIPVIALKTAIPPTISPSSAGSSRPSFIDMVWLPGMICLNRSFSCLITKSITPRFSLIRETIDLTLSMIPSESESETSVFLPDFLTGRLSGFPEFFGLFAFGNFSACELPKSFCSLCPAEASALIAFFGLVGVSASQLFTASPAFTASCSSLTVLSFCPGLSAVFLSSVFLPSEILCPNNFILSSDSFPSSSKFTCSNLKRYVT